jgi:hypothetical protein
MSQIVGQAKAQYKFERQNGPHVGVTFIDELNAKMVAKEVDVLVGVKFRA